MELMRLCGVAISDGFYDELFKWVDQDQTGTVDFRELVSVLSVVAHGSDEEKLLLGTTTNTITNAINTI